MKISTTIRVSEDTKGAIDELARHSGRPAIEVVAEAVERYRRESLLDQADKAYLLLRKDKKMSGSYYRELKELEGTLEDGLDEP